MNLYKRFLLVTLLFSTCLPAKAWWGANGHRIVGEIAESYLNAKARRAIQSILGNESIAMASNYGDFIKSDSTFDHISAWHYVNLKGGLSREQLQAKLIQDTIPTLYNKIEFLITELKNNGLSSDNKAFYLKLLIHFVGDLHQPLHVGGRPEDLGGNRIKVLWFSDQTNIHSVWDDKLIEHQKLSYTEYAKAINHVAKKQRKEWQQQPMMDWYWESYQYSQVIYAGITKPDQRLSYDYNFEHISTVNQQLLKGGVRLAGVLNEIFG
jgi:hypothetical protein